MEAEQSEERKNTADHRTARLETLTDGVFAIAMTLLVLGLNVPRMDLQSETELARRLLEMSPHFINYSLSFLLLSAFWVGHHMQFDLIDRSDRTLLWLNVLGLMFVAILPFSASLLSEHHGLQAAALFFEANLLAIGLISMLQWRYSVRRNLVRSSVSPSHIRLATMRTMVVPAVSLGAIGLSFLSPRWSTSIFFLIPLLLLVPRKDGR